MFYIAYLDEFGHIGPFISRNDPRHKDSPIFGLGGFIIPVAEVRAFGTWFFQMKCRLLDFEIKKSGEHPARWEKKGASLYTTTNFEKYPELTKATNRILNKIQKIGGNAFYVGLQKTHSPAKNDSAGLYRAVLMEAIKRLDQYCTARNCGFLLILDEQDDKMRQEIVESSGRTMYGPDGRKALIEPPIQAESHLYQTLQCADWICGLVGRLGCFEVNSAEYADFEWAEKYFGERIRKAAPTSGIRKQVITSP